MAYIASKTHYFGVGGGTSAFKSYIATDGMLDELPTYCQNIKNLNYEAFIEKFVCLLQYYTPDISVMHNMSSPQLLMFSGNSNLLLTFMPSLQGNLLTLFMGICVC